MIRCSSCQRSAVDSPALDLLELGLRRLELLLRARVVDLLHVDGVVDERDRAVELDLEEAGPGRELEHVVGAVEVDARRAGLERRDERRVPREHADLAGRARDDQHLRLAAKRVAVGGDDRDVELRMRRRPSVRGRGAAVCSAFSTASSIVPTM